MSPMSTAAMNAVDQSKAGVASGILSMNRMVGGVLGVAVLGTFIGQTTSQADFVNSLGNGLMIGAFVAAAGAIVAWTLHLAGARRRRRAADAADRRGRPPARGARARDRRRVGLPATGASQSNRGWAAPWP